MLIWRSKLGGRPAAKVGPVELAERSKTKKMAAKSTPNNPAGRLLEVCNKFHGMPNGTSIRTAWAKILGIDETDIPSLLNRIGVAISLISSTKKAVMSLPDLDHGLFLSWEGPLNEAFSRLNLGGENIVGIDKLLAPEVLKALAFCNAELSKRKPEPQADPNELAKLLEEVKILLDDVLESDLPSDIKTFVLEKLNALERAIELYTLSGIKPIEEVVESMLGGALLKAGRMQNDAMTETDLLDRYWKLGGRAAVVVALTDSGIKLLTYFKDTFIT